ncbi:sugar ABC transporter ATP-binding protein [Microbacterium sp.]|uniref:sugar ABC transporter ATP-binding protein n=1 Tax=Microbacterium sp. TaxID=51671 RepID=UPI003C73AE9E
MTSVLELEGVEKSFAGVHALRDIDFRVDAGEVHVLLGENGAGKSTLIKILAGIHRPDAGVMRLDGTPVRFDGPAAAVRAGIGTIHQELQLVPKLSVAENVLLGRQPRRFGIVSANAVVRAATPWLDVVGLDVDPRRPVETLGIARRQLVEIAKALSLESRILILDEPTAALTAQESSRLFDVMRRLRREGVAQVFISHHLEEIPLVGDRATVLRDGRAVGEVVASAPESELIRLMVGRSIDTQYPRIPAATEGAAPLLEVRQLTSRGRFDDISFDVRPGEVLGLAGLVGAGRTEVLRAIAGVDSVDGGEVRIAGARVPSGRLGSAIARGIALVPEDRKGQGLVLGRSVADNIGLASVRRDARAGFIAPRAQWTSAGSIATRLGIRMRGLGQAVRTLSGGNQQKVVIGKWLDAGVRVLLLDEPTRGVDVGARVELYELINGFTADGGAVVMVSSDLPEAIGMADRLLVMTGGRIVGGFDRGAATQESVMKLAVKEVDSSRVH